MHYHLGIPLIRRIVLRNSGETASGPGRIRISTTPSFSRDIERTFEGIEPGDAIEWELPDLRPDGEFLASTRERRNGAFRVEVSQDSHDTPEESEQAAQPPVVLEERSLAILAFNEWPGLNDLPELLAAYVTPNSACIAEVLHIASGYLSETTNSGSIDGYQSGDASRAYRIVEAIFRAVQSRQLTYVNPPPSYETTGQKVRFAEELWQSRQAACLDLALFFASALEAAGLHPLICVEKGHAYTGCWLLGDRLFDLAFEDDVQRLRKAADLHALCVFETTLVTNPSTRFASAETIGRKRLNNDTGFRWALDVARARSKRVRPLPLAIEAGRTFVAPEPETTTTVAAAAGAEAIEARFGEANREDMVEARRREPPDARIARWQRQLLDLSLHNRLLNLQERSCIRLLLGNLPALEDHLADAGEMQLLEKPETDARAGQLHARQTGESLTEAELSADLANQKLRTDETKEALLRKLTKLAREAQVTLDESGSNTLFLALGVLEWREHTGPSAKVRLAPLLLMPVHLNRRSIRSGFRLRRRDEDTQVNVTLLEKLRREFGIEVPGVDPPPSDDSGVDVRLVLDRFRKAVLDAPSSRGMQSCRRTNSAACIALGSSTGARSANFTAPAGDAGQSSSMAGKNRFRWVVNTSRPPANASISRRSARSERSVEPRTTIH